MLYARIIFCALVIACCAATQPAPELATPLPVAMKPGQTIEVSLAGKHLGAIQSAAVLDARGVIATLVDSPKDDQIRLKLIAATDASIGERQLRLVGPTGVTRSVRLLVSAYDVRHLTVADQPQNIELPATVIGQIATAGQLHQMRFTGRKGELLVFDVSARRSGSLLEAVLTVESENGRQLPCTLEHHAGDPLLLFTPPDDGVYVLSLRDLRFRGGPEYSFRIAAGHIPYLESVLPGSGKPGTVINARPVGYNLDGAEPISIDLTRAAPGLINVHANASAGISNEIPFEVTDLPQFVESEPNDRADEANPVELPIEISGSTDKPADEDFFRFHLPYKQLINLEVLSARFGSPMVPLLQLRSAKGDVIEANDGTPDSDARIMRELDAGEYLASIRDLAYSGGPGHWYRLKIEPARSLQPDFSVRFQPDAVRLHRGGSTAVWFDVRRSNGLRGDIMLVPQSLPPGVTASSLTLPENGSGWMTLSATKDASLGTTPLRITCQATIGMAPVTHDSQPDAYLTVLDAAPFTLDSTASLSPPQIDEANGRVGSLAAKLTAPDPRLDSAQARWEKKIPTQPFWKPLEDIAFFSAKGTTFRRLPDSSILVSGHPADQDEYTVVAHTNLARITAVRLEAMTDESLPSSGPGTAPNGNFVLSEIKLSAADGGGPVKPVQLQNATSDFAQESFSAAAAIDGKPETGWAIEPQEGRAHTAIFRTAAPIGSAAGTTLTFVLSHQSAFASHNLGRFRLSVTTLEPAMLNDVAGVPPAILALLAIPAEQRSAQQQSKVAAYYRSIDPELLAIRNQIAAFRAFVGPYAELQRLQGALTASSAALDAEQKQWEHAISGGDAWTMLQPATMTSDAGTSLTREADGSIFAGTANTAAADVFRITASLPFKSITAMRLELLPDPRLPANGPGRGDDGSFALTRIEIARTTPKDVAARTLRITHARATAEQKESPVSSLIDDDELHHWSAGNGMGLPVEATFYFDGPAAVDGPLSVALHQAAEHSLGRFRLWVTSNVNPDAAPRLPEQILAILKTPDATRSAGQKQRLSQYFRSTAPSLVAMRERVAELRAQTLETPLRARRNQPIAIPVMVNRVDGFTSDVTVTLEGYAPSSPRMIGRQIKVTPLVLKGDSSFGLVTIQPEAAADLATRMVVLKAETKMGDDVITQYSPAFPLTIQMN